jgi:hypothetical protein
VTLKVPASWPGALIPLMIVPPSAPGALIVVKPPFFNTKPCLPFASSNCPAIAFVLFPLAAVAIALGTSIVVKLYWACVSPGTLRNRPNATAASDFHVLWIVA